MLLTIKDVTFQAVRSSGPGGQNANRRSTKVHMWVTIGDLPLADLEKRRIRTKLAHHINHEDKLEVTCEEERSQELNRDKALEHMNALLEKALYVQPERIPTEPPRNLEDERISEKKHVSDKKQSRREGGNKQ